MEAEPIHTERHTKTPWTGASASQGHKYTHIHSHIYLQATHTLPIQILPTYLPTSYLPIYILSTYLSYLYPSYCPTYLHPTYLPKSILSTFIILIYILPACLPVCHQLTCLSSTDLIQVYTHPETCCFSHTVALSPFLSPVSGRIRLDEVLMKRERPKGLKESKRLSSPSCLLHSFCHQSETGICIPGSGGITEPIQICC